MTIRKTNSAFPYSFGDPITFNILDQSYFLLPYRTLKVSVIP